MRGSIAAAAWLLLAAFYLGQYVLLCEGHGFMLTPLSRGRLSGYAEWEVAGGNGLDRTPYRTSNDLADVCGDPHQDTGDMALRNKVTAVQATYSPGSTIAVVYRMRVNHGGWLGVKLCPSTRTNPSQGCFDQYPLTNANTGYQRWWIQTGRYGTMTDYTTQWRLPSGVSCDGGCVLQVTYRTANSCVDACSSAECGSSYAARNNPITGQVGLSSCGRTEIFKDCADVRITGSSGGGGTSSPVSPNKCDKCNISLCKSGCKCDSNCNCRPSLGGAPCDKCNLAQSEGGCKCDSNCNCLAGTCRF